MAVSPTPAAAPAMSDDSTDPTAGGDAGAATEDTGDDAGGDASADENVLLTVCKESDGTYSLIKGDESDAGAADASGAADEGAESNKQTFKSKGELLKAVLDVLNEDEDSAGADGSSGDQFQAGFDENAPAKPATLAQKY